jgi:hypothetical protein
MAQMQASAILDELQARGADLHKARVLVRNALVELRGEYRGSPRSATALGASGGSRLKWIDEFWVPVDKLRST